MDVPSPTPPVEPEANPPKKYIRTFAGDMEAVQSGGSPDLAPYTKEESKPQASVIAPPPAPVPLASAETQAPEATVPPPSPPAAPPPPFPTPIKTYAGDFSQHLKDTNASPVTVLAAEQDAGGEKPAPAPAQKSVSRASVLYVIAGIILLLGGGAGAYIAYTRYQTASAPVVPTISVSAPIFFEEHAEMTGSGEALLKSLETSILKPVSQNAVRLVYVASTTESFFSLLRLPAPEMLSRNVRKDGSMAGIIRVGEGQSPFFILSVSSYGTTFAGMLAWEPSMLRSLSTLYPPYLVAPASPAATASTSAATTTATTTRAAMPKTAKATTTATTTASVRQPGFRDEVISNHDVRVYRDAENRSIVLYGYWNPDTLVIARDPSAFAEILERLANSRAR